MTNFISRAAETYFRPKRFERHKSGLVYRLAGLHKVSKLIGQATTVRSRGTGFRSVFPQQGLQANSLRKAKRFETISRLSETVHTLTALPLIAYAATNPSLIPIATAIANLYLVGLQRYNRVRIYEILERAKRLSDRRKQNVQGRQ